MLSIRRGKGEKKAMDIEKIKQPDEKVAEEALASLRSDSLSRPDFDYLRKKIRKNLVSNPDCTLYLAVEKGSITGAAFFLFLEWDTSIFGFKIGRIEHIWMRMADLSDRRAFARKIAADIKAAGCVHFSCRLGLKDYDAIRLLEEAGFGLADIQMTLSTPDKFGVIENESGNVTVRDADEADLDGLKSLIKGTFTDTRFVNDARYPKEDVDRMYYEWVKNAMHDSAKRIFVAQENGSGFVNGFVILAVDADSEECFGVKAGYIDLTAVAQNYRNRGISRMLTRHVLRWSKDNSIDRVEIRTQVSNISAIRAFMAGGLSEVCQGGILPPGITMHYWAQGDSR